MTSENLDTLIACATVLLCLILILSSVTYLTWRDRSGADALAKTKKHLEAERLQREAKAIQIASQK